MKAILFNSNGFALYNDEFNTSIPGGAIEISDDLYADISVNQDGQWQLINGEVVKVPFPDLPPYIPQSVTPAQGLMALFVLKGITEDDILAAINTIADATLRYQAQIAYKKATVWERPSVTMQTLAGLLGLTESDLDELFILAVSYMNM